MKKNIPFIIFLLFSISRFSINIVNAQIADKTEHDIQLLIQEKNLRTPTEQKINSGLLQAFRESRGQKMIEGVNLFPAKVGVDDHGNLKVNIVAFTNNSLLSKIESFGGKIIYSSIQNESIVAWVNLSVIENIAGLTEVKYIKPAVKPKTAGKGIHTFPTSTNELIGLLSPYTGTVNSQGDRTHRADDVRNIYGNAGEGIKIGVISDSYNAQGGAAADVTNGNLPGTGNPLGNTTPVTVVADDLSSYNTDEGRAMLQLVHDVAPKAQLFFITCGPTQTSFANNIQTLRNAPYNCDIIVDDISFADEPIFQDGIIAQAINTVTAGGALYFTCAGNNGSLEKSTSGTWEGDFKDNGFDTTLSGHTGRLHNFGSTAIPVYGDSILSEANGEYTLNWSDFYGAATNDYDLFIVSANGSVKASSTDNNIATGQPLEIIDFSPFTLGDRLVIYKNTSTSVRALHLDANGGTLLRATTGEVNGHCTAVNALCIGTTPAASPYSAGYPTGPYPAAFNSSNKVELYSSDGPRRIFYNDNGTAITPGNVLFSTNGGVVRNKPDLIAADGVATAFSAASGFNPFYGCSAAAPHAAAIAALLKSANPALTAAQIKTILTSTALDIESPGFDNISGYGIVQAFQALGNVIPTWAGTTNNNWATASNWSVNRVPTSADVKILIPTGAANMPVIVNSNQSAHNLTIQPGASINVLGNLTIIR